MKQWAWNGRVTISVSGSSQTICERATLTDGTEAEPPRIGSFVHLTRDLEFASLFDVDDILMFLPICNPVHQFARLSAEGPDAEALEIVAGYMLKKKQAVMIPAIADQKLIGCLLFIPPASKSLLAYLKTPSDLCGQHGLVAVLLFVTHPPTEERYKKREVPRLQHRVERAVLSHELWLQSLRQEKAYHVAMGIVQLPAEVREFVYKHASMVWAKSSSADLREDQDTRHLLRVIKRSKVRLLQPTDTSADIAFIHVGALRNIHNFPHLAQRRLRPDFRFCVYGTHETVHPSRWGFQEIYLLGGVVTFTPQALIHDTYDVLRTIRNIHAHPLWLCYLIPEVVGMAIKLDQLREDGMQEYTGMLPYMMDRLFGAILDGQVALLQTPVNDPTDEDVRKWVLAHALFRPLTTQAILEYCTKAFEDAYTDTEQGRWAVVAKNDILTDMRRAQVQPALLTDYRRFILLDANSSRYSSVDGIECDTVARFKFNDDFVKDGAAAM
ncbi:hypothetical protein C8R47DRAFT_373156 [Mycena vitilis]|nr:hypothetical protein C8R47DRAFT_373156 [Mycena vitilis]